MHKKDLKKKNAKKACFHCKKSHRKCDDKRPCTNCVKFKKECYDQPNLTRVSNNIHPMHNSPSMIKEENNNTNIYMPGSNSINFNYNNINGNKNIAYQNNYLPNPFIPENGFELIKRESEKSEEQRLREEIEQIKKEIEEIDQLNIPDNIMIFDPVELFFFKENMNPLIPQNLFPNQMKAGSLYITGNYLKNIQPQNYNSRNIIIQNISENASLSFGIPKEQMIGKSYDLFCPKYSEDTWAKYGLKIHDLCKSEVNFIRIIDFGVNVEGKLFAYDSHCAIICDELKRPSFHFTFIKQINSVESNLHENDLSPRITSLD